MDDNSTDRIRNDAGVETDFNSIEVGSVRKEIHNNATTQHVNLHVPQTPQRSKENKQKTTHYHPKFQRLPTLSTKQQRQYRSKSFVSPMNLKHDFSTLPAEGEEYSSGSCSPAQICVEPLPKIRLDLMPCPREADEYEDHDDEFN